MAAVATAATAVVWAADTFLINPVRLAKALLALTAIWEAVAAAAAAAAAAGGPEASKRGRPRNGVPPNMPGTPNWRKGLQWGTRTPAGASWAAAAYNCRAAVG